MKPPIVRHVWVYAAVDDHGKSFVNTLVSPDANGVHLNTIPTPHIYATSRGDVRYIFKCETPQSLIQLRTISVQLYDAEFSAANIKLRRKMQDRMR